MLQYKKLLFLHTLMNENSSDSTRSSSTELAINRYSPELLLSGRTNCTRIAASRSCSQSSTTAPTHVGVKTEGGASVDDLTLRASAVFFLFYKLFIQIVFKEFFKPSESFLNTNCK